MGIKNNNFEKTQISKPADWLIREAQNAGLDYSALVHEYTSDTLRHTMRRHGDPKVHGKATVFLSDFEKIAGIVAEPDYVLIGIKRNNFIKNAYAKIIDGITYIYFEDVLTGRENKALRGTTLYKISKELLLDEFISKVKMNNKTDIEEARIVAVGGNPRRLGGNP